MTNPKSIELAMQDLVKQAHVRQGEPNELARSETRLDSSRLRAMFFALMVGISYYVGTKIGLAFTPVERPISTFWPPNAVLLAALLLAPTRRWWSLLLAALPAHLVAQLQVGIPVTLAIGWFVGNSAEALLGAACIRYFLKREQLFETVRGLVVFLIFGVMLAPLTTTFLDAAVVVSTGNGGNYWPLWAARLFSNTLAELTVVPVIVLFGVNGLAWLRRATLGQSTEAAALALMMVVVSILVFGMQPSPQSSIPLLLYLPLPFLLWASVRFGLGGMSASLLLLSVISIWNTMHGRGPFSTPSIHNVFSLQILLLVIAVPLMLLTAFIREHRRLERTLCDATGKLIDFAERERRRLAEELRDDINPRLSRLADEVEGLKAEPALRQRLEPLCARVRQISDATQSLAEKIYLSQLVRLGLAPTLRELCQTVKQEVADLEIDFIQEELPEDLPPKAPLCLYRITEEALRNLVGHSRARKAVVELKVRRQRILLRIVDDGVGWSPKDQTATGLGLANMRERARALGGTVEIVSRPMRGTMIEVSLPLKPPIDDC